MFPGSSGTVCWSAQVVCDQVVCSALVGRGVCARVHVCACVHVRVCVGVGGVCRSLQRYCGKLGTVGEYVGHCGAGTHMDSDYLEDFVGPCGACGESCGEGSV